jgi:hypothetical protein
LDISAASYYDDEDDIDEVPVKEIAVEKTASRKMINQIAFEQEKNAFDFPGVTNTRSK